MMRTSLGPRRPHAAHQQPLSLIRKAALELQNSTGVITSHGCRNVATCFDLDINLIGSPLGWAPRNISPIVRTGLCRKISDGAMVSLKKVSTAVHPYEADIGLYLCSNELSSDPDNHCVPLYDVLKDPLEEDIVILVMPLLRRCNDPEFGTVGEVVEFIRQLVNGLRFMHVHHVAHRERKRDFTGTARHYSRTERPTKYYYVDFGLSRKYSPDEYPPRELPILGGDKTVPEFQGEGYDEAVDPFPTDIYYLGNLIRMAFTTRYENFRFMDALIADMVQNEPQKRPPIEEVSSRFIEATSKLSARILRGRLVERDEPPVIRFLFGLGHLFRTAKTFTEANIRQISYVDCAIGDMNKFTTHRSRLPSLGRTTTVLGSNDFSSLGATPVCCIECTRRDVLIAAPICRVESTSGDIFLPAPVRCVKRTS
ncbi:hypothetical protein IEO21_10209 [Rhodonia placenta]|uniref:Protein kinase domain-containing protein n=1 Tax=Rhodonia placenta TaxID=104341 RepID=A0A8H7NT06_9APHY|nr:hypothetical protein IEO21_10209 [Postia placenta]